MVKETEDISRKTVLILVLIAITLSVISTVMVLQQSFVEEEIGPSSEGHVSFIVLENKLKTPAKATGGAEVGMDVTK